MRRILVGFDHSDAARRALDRGIAEARERNARLVVLSVFEMPLDPQVDRFFGTLDDIADWEGKPIAPPPELVGLLGEARDRLEVTVGGARRELVVLDVAEKRGPATVAATLYEETPASIARREELALERRQARPLGADLGARPTKRDRRRLDALRRAQQRRGQPPR